MSSPISLTFNQGETVQFPVTIKDSTGTPIDLTGYTFASDIRKEYTTPVISSFTINTTDLLNGEFVLELSATVTEGLPVNTSGRVTSFVFDLDMNDGTGVISTPISGYLKVVHRVTVNV